MMMMMMMLLLLLVVAGRLAKVLVGTPISGDFRGPPFRGKFGDGRAADDKKLKKNIYTKAGAAGWHTITAMRARGVYDNDGTGLHVFSDRCVLRRWPRSGGTRLVSVLIRRHAASCSDGRGYGTVRDGRAFYAL